MHLSLTYSALKKNQHYRLISLSFAITAQERIILELRPLLGIMYIRTVS